ncbi:MAG: hypothetical protein M0R22_02300 [Dehalococcoidia bacterium]|jgi:hypothetical protein|nr:hypothetical protein [Dehalococcoidia bacterium]
MASSLRRHLLHSALLLLVLVATISVLPGHVDAASCKRCPTGESDESGTRVEVNITLSVSPEDGGRIEVNGDEFKGDVFVAFQGDVVELEAVPARGYEFAGWTGSLTSDENPWETPFYNHKSITANFVLEREDLSFHEKSGLSVDIPDGTEALDPEGNDLDDVSIEVIKAHDIPDSMMAVSRVYEVAPSGATFDPPITLSLEYDRDSIPASVDDDELAVAWFDEEAGEWTPLESDVDEVDGIVSAEVSHFSEFCVLSPAPESASGVSAAFGTPLTSPGFSLSQLDVSPSSVSAGETVDVSVLAHYEGSSAEGVSQVVLRVDGIVVDEQQIKLSAGDSADVTFTFTATADGPHEVDVNGLLTGFSVTAAVVVAPAALSQAVALAQQDESSFQLEMPSLPSFSWPGGLQPAAIAITAVVVVLLLLLPVVRRRILRYRYDI